MVGIPTADEFMKHKDEFDATIDNASDDLNAGLLSVYCHQYLLIVVRCISFLILTPWNGTEMAFYVLMCR